MSDITTKELRKFGIVLGLILGAFGLIHYLKHHVNAWPWFWGFAAAAILVALIYPVALRPVYRVFTKVTHAIGWFNTRVILILLYYLLLTPIGLIMRLFGKEPLDRKIEKEKESYWIQRAVVKAAPESLEKQF